MRHAGLGHGSTRYRRSDIVRQILHTRCVPRVRRQRGRHSARGRGPRRRRVTERVGAICHREQLPQLQQGRATIPSLLRM